VGSLYLSKFQILHDDFCRLLGEENPRGDLGIVDGKVTGNISRDTLFFASINQIFLPFYHNLRGPEVATNHNIRSAHESSDTFMVVKGTVDDINLVRVQNGWRKLMRAPAVASDQDIRIFLKCLYDAL
jgi:hypothetical protein